MCVNKAHSRIVCHGDCLCILSKGAVGGGPALEHLWTSFPVSSLCWRIEGGLFCGATALLWLPGSGYAIKAREIMYRLSERSTTFSHTPTFDLFVGKGPDWERASSWARPLSSAVGQSNIQTASEDIHQREAKSFHPNQGWESQRSCGCMIMWHTVGYIQVQIRRSVGFVNHVWK